MGKSGYVRLACVSAAALFSGFALSEHANAGAFGIREQSAYFQGSSFAGDAAGGDISSMFWNSAATAELSGFNMSSNYTGIFGTADLRATSGALVTGESLPQGGGVYVNIPGNPNTSKDIGTNAFVPSSFATYQLNDRLFAGLAINAPDGFITKGVNWAGSPIAETSKVFSTDFNPTLAYKLTPQITVGIGLQVEYFEIRLTHGELEGSVTEPTGLAPPFPPTITVPALLAGSRSFKADDWGIGATAGVMWRPAEGTTLGLGYRSAVGVDVNGAYNRQAGLLEAGLFTDATGNLSLPDEVTLSIRQNVTQRLALLGTVEWQNWSHIQNVYAVGSGCGTGGNCETLNLNYHDGWLFAGGLEYAYSPRLTLRTGLAYETSPVQDQDRDILLPDSNRWHLSFGGTYKYSEKVSINLGYSHLFFEDAPFCVADASLNPGGTTHCNSLSAAYGAVLLKGSSNSSVDIVSVGLNYKLSDPRPALEPYK